MVVPVARVILNVWPRGAVAAVGLEEVAVLRVTLLATTVLALLPYSPLGCPPTDSTLEDYLPIIRGTLTTTASASVERAGVGEVITLQATSAAASGDTHFNWVQVGGPGVALTAADQATATISAPSLKTEETLSFLVTARDDGGNVGRAGVDVVVTADPNFGQTSERRGSDRPIANAGADQLVSPNTEVLLDGSRSSGTSLTYRWRQVSGDTVALSSAETAQTRFTTPAYNTGGTNTLLFELAVTDTYGRSMTDRVQIKIKNPAAVNPKVKLTTTKGDIVIELYEEKAPITVANFLEYTDTKFYNGTIFHRVIPNFVIQGGGFISDMTQKETSDPIKLEADNGLSNVRGTVAMARTNDPNSATSQFFINVSDNIKGGNGKADLDPGGVSAEGYCVFGRVVEGMDVVDAIVAVPTGTRDNMQDVPVETILINSARRVEESSSTGGTTPGGSSGGSSGGGSSGGSSGGSTGGGNPGIEPVNDLE